MGNCCASTSGVANETGPPIVSANIDAPTESSMPARYFSFASFFIQTEKAQVFEWLFINEIGQGAMSHVYVVKNVESEEICAAKVYDRGALLKPSLGNAETPLDQVNQEITIMADLSSPYLLQMIEVIDDDNTNSLIIVMPYALNGCLQTLIDKNQINETGLSVCYYQTAEALRYMHEKNVIHRDIKPDNILCFSDTYFVLSDFSVSTILEDPSKPVVDTKGSPAFLSPEECSGEPFMGKPADVWAYGVSLYSSVFGKLPFDLDTEQGCGIANTVLRVTELLESKDLEFPAGKEIDPNLKLLIEGTLNKDPAKRPTFEEIVKNEWFKEAWELEKMNHAEEEDVGDAQSAE